MSAHAHIYKNHFPYVEEYLSREEVNSPVLKLQKVDSIYDYTLDNFELTDYNPHPSMKVPISV
jgi:thymidylate synthase